MKKTRILLIILFIILYVASAVKTVQKARKGKGAFVGHARYSEMISRKEIPYSAKGELYPNPVMMLLIQKPFHVMGSIWGSFAWLTFKYLIILFIFWAAITVSANRGPPWPDWALIVLLVLNARVFFGDLTHANVNLFTGGLIALALLCSSNKQDFASGVSIGFAAAIRMTPALFIVYFIYKRRWICFFGAILGIFLFIWLVPGLILGFEYNNVLTHEWYKQMIHPIFKGESFSPAYNTNQSFHGLLSRLLTDTIAVKANIKRGYDALKINLAGWDYQKVSMLVKIVSLIVVGFLAWLCRVPKDKYRHLGNTGEYALVFLAMLFISPRSWKHHYILIILAHSFILYYLISARPSLWRKWVPLYSLIFASICLLLFSESTIGHYWSDVAEAYGVYLFGAIALFVGCAAILRILRKDGWPDTPTFASKTRGMMPSRFDDSRQD